MNRLMTADDSHPIDTVEMIIYRNSESPRCLCSLYTFRIVCRTISVYRITIFPTLQCSPTIMTLYCSQQLAEGGIR